MILAAVTLALSFLAELDWQGIAEAIATIALVGGGGHRAYLQILGRLDRLERRAAALASVPRRVRALERHVGIESEDVTAANGAVPNGGAS